MTSERQIETHIVDWQGITLSVTYEANWMNSALHDYGHLQIESLKPERAPLPITETGYRSHFLLPDGIEAHGGPVAYVIAWLDHEAKSPEWLSAEVARRQLSLF